MGRVATVGPGVAPATAMLMPRLFDVGDEAGEGRTPGATLWAALHDALLDEWLDQGQRLVHSILRENLLFEACA